MSPFIKGILVGVLLGVVFAPQVSRVPLVNKIPQV